MRKDDLSVNDGRHTVTGSGGGVDGLLSLRRLFGLLSTGLKLESEYGSGVSVAY